MNTGIEFLQSAKKRFKEYKGLADKTFDQLNDDEMIWKPNEASNSIAVIIKHMHGNMLSRWTNFLTEDGEKEWRKRDDEFEEETISKQQLLVLWQEGWNVFLDTLESLKEQDLLKTITIRNQPLSVIDAVNRQMAHYSSHVGQIIYIGRLIKADQWETLSIPKKGSEQFNQVMKSSKY